MPTWIVAYYRNARGRVPVTRYLDTLPPKDRAPVLRTVALLDEYGPALKMPHARHLKGKLWELRVDGHPGSYRVLHAAVTGRRFLLLHVFANKTEKTPEREITTALNRLANYLREAP